MPLFTDEVELAADLGMVGKIALHAIAVGRIEGAADVPGQEHLDLFALRERRLVLAHGQPRSTPALFNSSDIRLRA